MSESTPSILEKATPRRTLVAAAALSTMLILGAFAFEEAGYLPCDLCLKQRWAHYAVMGVAVIAFAAERVAEDGEKITRLALGACAVTLLAGSALAVYHAGVEWNWWSGPSSCSGANDAWRSLLIKGTLPDLSRSASVSCDDAAWRLAGISLAGWNAILSTAAASVIAVVAAKPHVRAS